MIRQRTLRNAIKATGVGLHTGEKVYLTLCPAPVNTGIVFRRVDLDPVVEIPARAERLEPACRLPVLAGQADVREVARDRDMVRVGGAQVADQGVQHLAPVLVAAPLSPRQVTEQTLACELSRGDDDAT